MLIDFHIREDILKHFPEFEYFNCAEQELLDFAKPDNLVGMQQEAFINFWIIKRLKEDPSGCGIDIGCGQNIHFACLGVNDYYGDDHPVYRGKYIPNITSLAENIDTIFNQSTFSFIVASHILEHVDNPIVTFRKWCKLLRKNGIIILLMPNSHYEIFKWDMTHKNFYTPEDFKNNCIFPNRDLMNTEEIDTLHNNFSFNYIGRRI